MHKYLFSSVALFVLGLSACQSPVPPVDEATQSPDPVEFLRNVEAESLELDKEVGAAYWVRSTHITPDTGVLAAKAGERQLAFQSRVIEQARSYKGLPMDAESARAIELILRGSSLPAPNDAAKRAELSQLATDLEGMYGAGEYCDADSGVCSTLPELENILAKSRDYSEQLNAWTGWRTVSPPMRPMYERFVELANEGAREVGAKDLGDLWKGGYDMGVAEFEQESERLWSQVEPLYEALHCHVRAQLSSKYGEDLVPSNGPIPAHLLGNMWSQSWGNIYDLLEPYPGVASLDVNKALVDQEYDAVRMTETAEAFFTSLGLPELPDSFWQNSMLTKPADRDVVCHASAWDLDNGNDPRIKQCVEVNEEQLSTLHHELGHIYYHLM